MALAPVLQVFLKNKTCFNISPLPSHFCGVHFSEHILPNAHHTQCLSYVQFLFAEHCLQNILMC